jgi:lipocalin
LFDCGITGVPEGSLFILSRSPFRDEEYVKKIFKNAKYLGVDVLVQTDVPQADSGLFG